MKLSDLILAVGDENVQMQNLQRDMLCAEKRKRDAKITFATSHEKADALMRNAAMGKREGWVGMVVWLPVDKLPPGV